MPFLVRYVAEVEYMANGAGAIGPVPIAQKLRMGTLDFKDLTTRAIMPITTPGFAQPLGYQAVPGGDAPTQANFRTALYGATGTPAGGMLLDLDNTIGFNLARIVGFASGGG